MIAGMVKAACLKNQDRTAISTKEGYRTKDITYSELDDMIGRTSRLFEKLKIKKGDRIVILGKNCVEYVSLFLAAVSQGIIVVPLDIQSDNTFIRKIMKETKPKAFFTSKRMTGSIGFDELDGMIKDLLPKDPAMIEPDDVVEILYTSGTTGVPKGVVLTNRNFEASLEAAAKKVKLPRMKFISVLPLSHILEQVAGLLVPLRYGGSILYPGTLRPGKLSELMRNKGINGMICVPAIMESLKGKDPGFMFFLIGVGGAKLDTDLEKYWKRRCKLVIQGYGLTETAALVTTNTLLRKRTGSVGRKLPGVEVKIEDEVLVKGDNVFSGYYKDKEKTEESFKDGWFKTGDIGRFKGPYLYLEGRKKDMIVTKAGENVYPYDIEKILDKMDGVKESCVIEHDGALKALIIPNKKVNLDEVIRKANLKLMQKQKISSYDIRSSFPKTALGKIKRYMVKAGKKEKKIVHGDKLMQIIADVTNKRPRLESKLGHDLLLDSLKRVQLVTRIEDEFHVEIPEQDIDDNTTVKHLQELVDKQEKVQRFRMEKWLLNPATKFIRMLLQEIWIRIVNIFARVECHGIIPNETVIFMPNHQSALDIPCLLRCLPFNMRNKIACAASPARLYSIPTPKRHRIYRKLESIFVRLFANTFPFGTEIGVDRSLEFTGEMLDRGYSLFVFPEGRRTRTGRMGEFQRGTGFLSVNMKAKVVPVKLEGLHEVLPPGKFWPRFGRVKITFGKPMEVKHMSYIEATKKIEKAVKSL